MRYKIELGVVRVCYKDLVVLIELRAVRSLFRRIARYSDRVGSCKEFVREVLIEVES